MAEIRGGEQACESRPQLEEVIVPVLAESSGFYRDGRKAGETRSLGKGRGR